MNILRIVSILLILATLCSVFSACSGKVDNGLESLSTPSSDLSSDAGDLIIDKTNELFEENGTLTLFANGAYRAKLIHSATATDAEKALYTQIKNLLKELTGIEPTLTTDTAATAEKYSGPAILLGNTSYNESKNAAKRIVKDQATATFSGNKYVLSVTTKNSVEKLVSAFKTLLTNNATKEKITIDSKWKLEIKNGTIKMTKSQWLNQYKSTLSERDLALLQRSYEVLEGNTLQGDNMPWGSDPAISPWSDENATGGLWNWDSMFHAMTVCRYDGKLAMSCIDNFAKFQKDNGILPDVVYANGTVIDNYTKPPVYAWAVLTVYESTHDLEFLKRNYDRAVKYENFWRTERFDNGLFYYSAQENPEKDNYLHPRWESGWDNSPRWDVAPIVDLYPIDLNCYMVLYYRSMAKMADVLGKSSTTWEAREKELTAQIESRLYNSAIGAYVDRNRKTGEFSTVLSPASFMPLFIGTASAERASAMNKLAKDTTKFYPGMPSVSYDNKGYNNDYWRGPTWMNIAFFAVKGLSDYGFTDTANEIKEFLLNMSHKNLPYIYENYDTKTQTGKSHNLFSWSSVFIIEFILQFNSKEQ